MPGSAETHPFREMLRTHVVVFDGAMGTMLYAAGIPYSQCFDALNLSRPDLVRGIHEAYLRAGAEILETNFEDSWAGSAIGFYVDTVIDDDGDPATPPVGGGSRSAAGGRTCGC